MPDSLNVVGAPDRNCGGKSRRCRLSPKALDSLGANNVLGVCEVLMELNAHPQCGETQTPYLQHQFRPRTLLLADSAREPLQPVARSFSAQSADDSVENSFSCTIAVFESAADPPFAPDDTRTLLRGMPASLILYRSAR